MKRLTGVTTSPHPASTDPATPDSPPPRRRRLTRAQRRAALIVLVLAAVPITAAINNATSTTRHTSTSPPPVDGGTAITAGQLIAYAGDTLPCQDQQTIATPVDAQSQVNCDRGRIVVRVYDKVSDAVTSITYLGLAGRTVLTGYNWTITSDDPTILPLVQTRLGGQITDFTKR